ncbi:MAG: VOC family protein [Gemmatimonadales bacterium]
MTPVTPLHDIGQIAVHASDIARATAYYRDALGLPFLFDAPGLAFFQAGTVRLMLSGPETPEFDHASSVLYFNVTDIASAHRTLAGRGVRFRDQPHVVHRTPQGALWMSFFDDSEGNVHAIMEWKAAG